MEQSVSFRARPYATPARLQRGHFGGRRGAPRMPSSGSERADPADAPGRIRTEPQLPGLASGERIYEDGARRTSEFRDRAVLHKHHATAGRADEEPVFILDQSGDADRAAVVGSNGLREQPFRPGPAAFVAADTERQTPIRAEHDFPARQDGRHSD